MCTNPLLIRNKRIKSLGVNIPHSFIKVPCGECDECLQKRSNDIYIRARSEYDYCLRSGGCGFMCCLTYSNETLPIFEYMNKKYMVFNKKDVIDFIKRLRTNLDRMFKKYFNCNAPDFKYLVTSEFGSDPDGTHRPHYHLDIFFVKPISLYLFNLAFKKSLCKRVGKKIVPCFGFIYQCDLIDPARGGIHYSCKYILKDLMYEPQRKAILEKLKFQRSYVNNLYGVLPFAVSAEEELFNSAIRSRKDYKQAIAKHVRPYRHMLQFYMLSNDLGVSAIIRKYGEHLLHEPVINLEGFPYSLPKLVRQRIEKHYGFEKSAKLAKQIFMNYVEKSLSQLLNQQKINVEDKQDLRAFADNFVVPFGGAFYLRSFDGSLIQQNLLDYGTKSWDDILDEFNFYGDNDFFSLRNRLFRILGLVATEEDLKLRASVARMKREKAKADYEKKKRNNGYKR